MLVTILLAVGSGFAAYLVLHWLLPPGADPVQPKDLTQFALAMAAGIGGVVALVVAYRRQHGIEQGLFVERFGAAASQLGHSDVAVRLAGVYAMAGVADEVSGLERQQCVDVLCSYLRLPYTPELGANHQSELQLKVCSDGAESTQKYLYRQNDREVRQTIVRVIASHLQPSTPTSWSRCNFDLRGAVLESPHFSHSVFRGSLTSFEDAVFHSGADFDGVVFGGELTSFERATFNGDVIWFDDALFTGEVYFDRAAFSAKWTSFGNAEFRGVITSFEGVTFCGRETTFRGVAFSRSAANFGKVTFSSTVDFSNPSRWDPPPQFDWDDRAPEVGQLPRPDYVLPRQWPPGVRAPSATSTTM